jgi:bacterioferritin (cytochrome b1)
MSESIENLLKNKSKAQNVEGYSSVSVVDLLKRSMNIHWQQTIELSSQAVHLERWGYKKLAELFKGYSEEEHEHAMVVIDRLEFFDQDYQPITVTPRVWKRHDIKAIIEFNLEGVRLAAQTERAIIFAAREVLDEITANIVTVPLLKGSDDGIKEFEGMLRLIQDMGIDNFLTLQV